jgi:predicted type IV restriction endonuclease
VQAATNTQNRTTAVGCVWVIWTMKTTRKIDMDRMLNTTMKREAPVLRATAKLAQLTAI